MRGASNERGLTCLLERVLVSGLFREDGELAGYLGVRHCVFLPFFLLPPTYHNLMPHVNTSVKKHTHHLTPHVKNGYGGGVQNQRVIDAINNELERTGTQKQQLAEAAGLTPETVSRILSGKHKIITKGANAVLAALNLTLTAQKEPPN
jgi:hypothetical protein